MKITALTATPVQLITISRFDFETIHNKRIEEAFMDIHRPYPEDLKLREIYFETNKWKKYKAKFLNQMKSIQNSQKSLLLHDRNPIKNPLLEEFTFKNFNNSQKKKEKVKDINKQIDEIANYIAFNKVNVDNESNPNINNANIILSQENKINKKINLPKIPEDNLNTKNLKKKHFAEYILFIKKLKKINLKT